MAQSGSAPALGAGSRGFKSLYPDHLQKSCRRLHLYRNKAVIRQNKAFGASKFLVLNLKFCAPVAQQDRATAFDRSLHKESGTCEVQDTVSVEP